MPPTATDQQVESPEEQSEPAEAADQAEGDEPGVKADQEGDESEEEAEELLSKDQLEALKDDPAKLRKELNRAATKKFQTLSADRKRLEPYQKLIDALEADPEKTILAMANRMGLKVEGSKKEVQAAAETISEKILASVTKGLGPEYQDLAERLAPVLQEATQAMVAEQVRELKEEQNRLVMDAAERESATEIEAFGRKFPDWRKHEEAMTELSKKLQPGEGMSTQAYLENLYYLVTREGREGDGIKKVVKKMTEAAKNSSGNSRSVSSDKIASGPQGIPSFAEAAEAARRGQRFE